MIYYHFLPYTHVHKNWHTFNWTETQLLDQAKTKHAREFKEAWYSVDKNTINRHIDIPPFFLQLKHSSNLNNSHWRAPAQRVETTEKNVQSKKRKAFVGDSSAYGLAYGRHICGHVVSQCPKQKYFPPVLVTIFKYFRGVTVSV